jgi:hypothetical protein
MTPTTARPYLFPPPYTVPLTNSRILPVTPPYDGPRTAYGQPFLSQENPSSPSHRNPAYLVRPPFSRTRGRLPRPFPISKFCQIPALSPFGRGNSRTWDPIVGYFWGFHARVISSLSITDYRKEDAKMWDLFYFSFSNSILISFTIFSGKVQSSAGCFSQLYNIPLGLIFLSF